jgi:hypothetical protein
MQFWEALTIHSATEAQGQGQGPLRLYACLRLKRNGVQSTMQLAATHLIVAAGEGFGYSQIPR